jgi:hypothetical protein
MMNNYRARNRIDVVAELTTVDHLPLLPVISYQ